MDLNLPETEAAAPPGSLVEPRINAPALFRILPSRQMRIFELRKAIEAGEYRVSSCDLADALLRSGRGAN
jgi:anti-sigma28 factor (negative regulator of flagellin synthesis)